LEKPVDGNNCGHIDWFRFGLVIGDVAQLNLRIVPHSNQENGAPDIKASVGEESVLG
jgi:hypothetical protein